MSNSIMIRYHEMWQIWNRTEDIVLVHKWLNTLDPLTRKDLLQYIEEQHMFLQKYFHTIIEALNEQR